MKFTKQINKALHFAAKAHEKQIRKDVVGTPYIAHPVAVAMILSQHTADEEIIIAGLLHDVIEDCGVTQEELAVEFGERVAQMVSEVSEDISLKAQGEKESWRARKEKYLQNLRNDSEGALMICAADKIHNLMSIEEGLRDKGQDFWKSFNASKEDKLWFYGEVTTVLKGKTPEGLTECLEKSLERVSADKDQAML